MSKESAYFLIDSPSNAEVRKIRSEIGSLPGVGSVSLNKTGDRLAVDFDNTGTNAGQIGDTLRGMGFDTTLDSRDNHLM